MKNKTFEKIIRPLLLFGYPFLLGLNATQFEAFRDRHSEPWVLLIIAPIYLLALLKEQ